MDRLTERDEFGNADIIALSDMMPELYAGLSFSETNALTDALNKLAAYEDTGLTPEDVPSALEMSKIYVALQKLKAYQQAEAEGRLIVTPVKVGDTVYTIWDNEVRDNTVTALVVDGLGQHILAQYNRGGAIRDYNVDCLGKTVFTSREAAEAALKEAQG